MKNNNFRIMLPSIFVGALVSSQAVYADGIDFKMETKVNYRNSDDNHWPVNFPFHPEMLPVGQSQAWLETVDEGSHIEVSNIAFFWNWIGDNKVTIQAKVDAIDLYERNPTSSDYNLSIDRFILRYGDKHTQGALPEDTDFYVQFGKFGKFERQEDRHTESYGLVSTAFNRVEDSGLELGVDGSAGWYGKFSLTSGNPVFVRDPNALAGDHGVEKNPPVNFDPDLKVGVPILYDAEVEGFDFSNPELGAALGYRWVSATGDKRINLMAFHYQRDMADSVDLHGTFYGGDIDVIDLSEVVPGLRLPYTHNEKDESGLNLWWYGEQSSVFAQYVTQDIAGLERDGWEIELAYAFNTRGSIAEALRLKRIVPVVRYSELTTDYGGPAVYPSPSLWWDWTKIDAGFTLDFSGNLSLMAEYAITEFVRGGVEEENNEILVTLTWRFD